jgi:hypothetical protein
MPIIESAAVPTTKEVTITRYRPWRERLWSWPWRPWVATVEVTQRIPSHEVYVINTDDLGMQFDPPVELGSGMHLRGRVTIVMHPSTAAMLKKEGVS